MLSGINEFSAIVDALAIAARSKDVELAAAAATSSAARSMT
jgi:hypothetical protein